MKGSAATRARVVSGLAVGLGLLTVGLKVTALLFRWPFAHDETLFEGLSETLLITLDVPYALVGALICARQPWNRMGWLLVVGGLANGGYVAAMYVTHGRQQLAEVPVTWMTGWLFWLAAFITLMFLLLLYPTGRLLSRRWRPVAWAVGAWGSSGWPPWSRTQSLATLGSGTRLVGVDLGASSPPRRLSLMWPSTALVSLVMRFRRARGVERPAAEMAGLRVGLSAAANTLIPVSWAAGVITRGAANGAAAPGWCGPAN